MSKKALVLSGGGSKGAYSVGVVKALLEHGNKRWDVISGVSVGALIGAHLAMYSPNSQASNVGGLERVWLRDVIGNESIYKPWAPWIFKYIWSLWKGGVYNMKPLRNILEKEVDRKSLRKSGVEFHVGVVSLQTGKYRSVNVTSNEKNNELAVDWIWASSVFPVLFPPVEIENEQWVDGGVRNVIPINDVFQYQDVDEIDAIITSPREGSVRPSKKTKSSIGVGLRATEVLSDEVYKTDLHSICLARSINLNIYEPNKVIESDSFEFNPDDIKKLVYMGYEETIKKM